MDETGDCRVLLDVRRPLAGLVLAGGPLAFYVSGPGRMSFDGAGESDD
jgi:hypothetical protein